MQSTPAHLAGQEPGPGAGATRSPTSLGKRGIAQLLRETVRWLPRSYARTTVRTQQFHPRYMLFTSTHPHVLTADLPTTANWWNQAKCPSMSKQINKTRNTVQQPGAKHGHTLALGPDTWRDSPTGRFRMGKLRGRRSRRLPRAEQGAGGGCLPTASQGQPRGGRPRSPALTVAGLLGRNSNCSLQRGAELVLLVLRLRQTLQGERKLPSSKQTETLLQAA